MRTPLQKGEKILLVTFSSWLSLAAPAAIVIACSVIAYFIGFLNHYGWLLTLLGVTYFLYKFFAWRSYIWVVTNFRVIDEIGLLRHYAKESPLDKINNVSYDQSIWGRILNYGHVQIQTAAQVGATDYYLVHRPKSLKDTITQAQADLAGIRTDEQFSKAALLLANQSQPAGSQLASELEKLYALKQKGILTQQEYEKAKSRILNS